MKNILNFVVILIASITCFISCEKLTSFTCVDIVNSAIWTHQYNSEEYYGDLSFVFQEDNRVYIIHSKLVAPRYIYFDGIFYAGTYFQKGSHNEKIIIKAGFKDEVTDEEFTIDCEEYINEHKSNFDGRSLFITIIGNKGTKEIWELKNIYDVHTIEFPIKI